MKRETSKSIEVMGRKFQIKKFDAYTGSYILFQLIDKFMPMGMEQKIPVGGSTLSDALPKGRTGMTKQEFISFQRDCLSVVSEVLPARATPIINANGSWGVENIADNTFLVILLMIHALTFNVADFFGEEGLKELKSSLAGISLASLKI